MKKIICTLFVLFVIVLNANADVLPDKIYAAAHGEINKDSLKKGDTFYLYAYGDYNFESGIKFSNGEKITLTADLYNKPKRGKRNGYYTVIYVNPEENGEKTEYKGTMRVSTPQDVKELVKKAGLTVAGQVLKVPGFSQAIAAAKGLISPNENEGRLKSAGENIYKSTPLVYAEKGIDFSVQEDDLVVLKLRKAE